MVGDQLLPVRPTYKLPLPPDVSVCTLQQLWSATPTNVWLLNCSSGQREGKDKDISWFKTQYLCSAQQRQLTVIGNIIDCIGRGLRNPRPMYL